MTRSITRRVLISNLVMLIAFLGLAAAALDRAFRASTETAMRDRLQAHVYTLLTAATEDLQGRMRLPAVLANQAFNHPDSGLYAQVEGEEGSYRWRSASLVGRPLRQLEPIEPGAVRFQLGPQLALFDQGILWEDNTGMALRYSLSVAMDRRTLDAQTAEFRGTLWRWLGGVAALLLLAQLLAARWGLGPVHEMSLAVQRIERGEAERIEGDIPAELRGLGDNLNSLIEQNQSRQARVRNSLADLAHSMKTPLAVLRGAGQQHDDRGLRELIDEQTRRIDQIVSYQRQRAAVAGRSRVARPLPLGPVLQRLQASLDKVFRERALTVNLALTDGLQLRADEGDLFELFGNLLENAYKHAHSSLAIRAERQGSQVVIVIEADGRGIAPEEIERLLQRGERADQRFPGEGIGLAVVNEIVAQYHGRLDIRQSTLGGALFRVTLPA